ncbi:MAG: endolytic transglycosylase MltG [Acidobacteria bacterium]|nr:MAG: endolytic transglycosylase MltG [Acidobacteriota bacterium]PYY10264.1 MAG: endolytic transglycosylase MltG [Acidobacteriota bacterium]
MRKILIFLLLVLIAADAWLAWALFLPVSPSGQKFVLLRSGYSTRRIATELKNAGVIRNASAFVIWHYFHRGRSLKAGEYLFEKPGNVAQVHRRLSHGDIYVHTVVIPEGFTIFDVAQAIQDAGLGPSNEFLSLAKSGVHLIRDLDPQARSLEGYLFPDTYQFTRAQSLQDILAAMVKRFRQEASTIGLHQDVHRIVTMASIVEKETAVPEERSMVASVYYNRLAKRIALDADPSVIYAELLDGTYQGALHHDDLRINSPYNTYRYAGLPPGPIANPGRSSLQAAMNPANSDYYYFVSNGNGHHRFARSLEEHNRNVAAFRRTLQGR